MATRVLLLSPGLSLENVVEGVGAAIQSSFVVALTVDLGTGNITESGTTRAILKSEIVQIMRTLEAFLERDSSGFFDTAGPV